MKAMSRTRAKRGASSRRDPRGRGASARLGRRALLGLLGLAALGLFTARGQARRLSNTSERAKGQRSESSDPITLFLCGDVMTGRGIDQVLPFPGDPRLCESYVTSALQYVELAETANGPISKPVGFSYIWGEALAELERVRPDVRIINLETSITKSETCVLKGVNYRMNPENIPCITAANIDCCALANNHVLDWGSAGLVETLETLERGNVNRAGAGRGITQAEAPAVMEVAGKGRVIVFSFGSVTSGIPLDWAAMGERPGVNLLTDLSHRSVGRIAQSVGQVKRPGDIVVASIHWGGNWGYRVPPRQTEFAHKLIDEAAVDVIHGHSSHHAKAIEVYKEKPILYGCGDFLNDYEGIRGYEQFRDDLVLMYFASFAASSGRLTRFEMTPLRIKNFKLNRASREESRWLRDTLNREGESFGTRLELNADNTLTLRWG